MLWEAAKQLFRWYILSVGVYDRIYGPLGALVALSMFAYYSGIVFVLGAEFAAALGPAARHEVWVGDRGSRSQVCVSVGRRAGSTAPRSVRRQLTRRGRSQP